MICEKWTVSCHISKQSMSQSSVISALQCQWALRELKKQTNKKKKHLPSSSRGLQPLPTVSPEETQNVKTKDAGPGSWGAYQRNDFSEHRPLHILIHRKLNSLTWDIWFSLVSNHILMSWWRRNSQGLDSTSGLSVLIILSHLSNGLWTLCLAPVGTTMEG